MVNEWCKKPKIQTPVTFKQLKWDSSKKASRSTKSTKAKGKEKEKEVLLPDLAVGIMTMDEGVDGAIYDPEDNAEDIFMEE